MPRSSRGVPRGPQPPNKSAWGDSQTTRLQGQGCKSHERRVKRERERGGLALRGSSKAARVRFRLRRRVAQVILLPDLLANNPL
eukprot:3899962-Pyramimonas_sp.AAC.2